MKTAFDEINESGSVSYSTLSSIQEKFAGVSGIDAYISKLAAARGNAEEIEQVMGDMIDALVNAKFASEDLANADENVIAAMLEEVGVVNAAEHAHWLITDAKAKNIVATYDLTNATEDSLAALLNEIQGLLGEGDAAQFEYVAALRMEQILTNQNALDSTDSVNSLIEIAAAAGASTTALSKLAHAKEAIASGSVEGFHLLDQMDDIEAAAAAEAQSIVNTLKSAVSVSFTGASTYKFKPSSSSTSKSGKDVEEYEAELDALYEKLQAIQRIKDDIERENAKAELLDDNDFDAQIEHHKSLIQMYEKEQTALHALAEARRELISANLQTLSARGVEYDYDAANNTILIRNMERINELSATTKGKYDSLQEATNAYRKETEELINTTIEMVGANRDSSDRWWDLENSINEAKVAIVNDLKDIVDKTSDAVDEIQSVSDALHEVADEYAANDGFITFDSLKKLKDVGLQYMQLLEDENGVWEINEERINAVIAARTRQMAVENAMSYVERIKLATQEGSIENLNDLIFVTTDATNSTWGLVYAELELMHTMADLNDSQYQAALHNIQAMQDLAENAIQNIGKATDSVATGLEETRKQLEATKDGLQDTLDDLEEMRDGAGDLVDYVMDMLKHKTEQQIEALEKAKDSVKDS